MTLDKAPLELGVTVEACIAAIMPSERSGNRQWDIHAERVWVDADGTRLTQVVTNLLTNAVKYTHANGSIEVRVERVGDEAVLRVKDDGVGIPPEVLPHVFELFTQARPAPVDREGGLGIGLALVQHLVGLHGGCVEALSDGDGRGAEFVVRLPSIEPVT